MDVAVLGADSLGRDLAAVAARAGHVVHLHDAEATAAMDAIDEVERSFDDAVAAGELSATERDAAVERLDATTGLEAAVGDAAFVVVTGRTDEADLQSLFAEVEDHVDRESVVATTACEGSVTAAAAGLRHPDRAIGLHVTDPRSASLIEVVVPDQADADTVDRATEFVDGLGLVPVVVADVPGVVSTRLALASEVEAMLMVVNGVASVADVDDAVARTHDHPVGPLERADRAGLDARLASLERLADALGERFRPPGILADLVDAGHTGMRAGEGFYVWENGTPTESALPDPDVVDRVAGPDDPSR